MQSLTKTKNVVDLEVRNEDAASIESEVEMIRDFNLLKVVQETSQ